MKGAWVLLLAFGVLPRPTLAASVHPPRARSAAKHWSAMLDPARGEPLAGEVHLVVDYDDTLAKTWRHTGSPEPKMAAALREDLRLLSERKDSHVTVSSGRPLDKLEEFFDGAPRTHLIGNFGMQSRLSGRYLEDPVAEAARPSVRRLVRELVGLTRAHGLPRQSLPVLIRDKGTSLSLHRGQLAPAAWQSFREAALRLIQHKRKLTYHATEEVIEVSPKGAADKGSSLARHLADLHRPEAGQAHASVLVIYGGDSPAGADRAAFELMQSRGASVHVIVGGDAPSALAKYYADGVDDFAELIHALAHRPQKSWQ
jgi:trehalose-phosphatase